MSETVHTALAYWQAGRPDEAFRLTRARSSTACTWASAPATSGSMNLLRRVPPRVAARLRRRRGVAVARAGRRPVRRPPRRARRRAGGAPGFPEAWDARACATRASPSRSRARATSTAIRRDALRGAAGPAPHAARPPRPRGVGDGGRSAARFRVVEDAGGPRVDDRGRGGRGARRRRHLGGRPIAPPAPEAEPAEPTPEPFDWSAARPTGATWDPVDLRASFNDRADAHLQERVPDAALAVRVARDAEARPGRLGGHRERRPPTSTTPGCARCGRPPGPAERRPLRARRRRRRTSSSRRSGTTTRARPGSRWPAARAGSTC